VINVTEEETLKVLEDKKFLEKLLNAPTEEDARLVFKKKGVDVTPQELDEIRRMFCDILENDAKKTEVFEEFLEDVVGGGGHQNVNVIYNGTDLSREEIEKIIYKAPWGNIVKSVARKTGRALKKVATCMAVFSIGVGVGAGWVYANGIGMKPKTFVPEEHP
jgi:hypothetical protein